MPLFAGRHSARGVSTCARLGRRKSTSTIGCLRRRFVVERTLHRHGQLVVLSLSHGCTLLQCCLHIFPLEPAGRLTIWGRLMIAIRPPLYGLQRRVCGSAVGCIASNLFASRHASTLPLILSLHLFTHGRSHSRSAQASSPPVIQQAVKQQGAANKAADHAAVHKNGRADDDRLCWLCAVCAAVMKAFITNY